VTDIEVKANKFCHKCKQDKPRSDFYKLTGRGDGLQTQCKACQVEAKALWSLRQGGSPELKEMQRAKARESASRRYWKNKGVDDPPPEILEKKKCGTCEEIKPAAEFFRNSSSRDGYQYDCRVCVGHYRRKRSRNAHDSYLRSNYRMTIERFDEMRFRQRYRCAKCFVHEDLLKTRLHVDHHHDTAVLRGLLCFDCNVGIGKLGDTAESVYQAVCYLLTAEGISEQAARAFDEAARMWFGDRAMYFFPKAGERSCRTGDQFLAAPEAVMSRDDQLPLFDSPQPVPARPRQPRPPSDKVRYARARLRVRTLCDDCCLAIHELGQALAPLPRRALWRRTDAAGSMMLCQAHKDERHDEDAR